jgi:hypothetical protein
MKSVLVLVDVIFATVLVGGCQGRQPKTATQLMQEFKNDPEAALIRYKHQRVTFTGILRRPPWEKAIYQYGGGKDALVYFITDTPGEWFFCDTPYGDNLRHLREGDRYVVSGTVYHFESEGKLFLMKCTLQRVD